MIRWGAVTPLMNLPSSLVSLGGLRRGARSSYPAWLDQGAKNDNAQDDDEDLRADPLAQIDLAVSGCLA
jgi:hypothetical protein